MSKQTDVTFVDTSKEVKQTLAKLSKTALRASGKVVRRLLRERIPVRSKRLKNHIASWAFIDKTTGQPQLQIGFYTAVRVRKKGNNPHTLPLIGSNSAPSRIPCRAHPKKVISWHMRKTYSASM